jgi:2-keto-4-pentenoate hydratase/2-oxohepta-3-ene-1,7-dioic acid hydratase in catechol pathway
MADPEPGRAAAPDRALVSYRVPGDARLYTGTVRSGAICRLAVLDGFAGVMELVERWEEVAPRLRDMDLGAAEPVTEARVTAPLIYPRKMLFAGANYRGHAAEMGVEVANEADPYFFLKPPTTTVIGPADPIVIGEPDDRVDWEAELAVVIGRRVRAVGPEEGMAAVAGYTVVNDVSARGRLWRAVAPAEAFRWDWLASKGKDTFCPMGPGLVPAWEVVDPQQLRVRLWVNGVLKQNASTADMIVPVPALVAAASRILTLEPGDVIATGTPAGVGAPRGEQLRPGDVVVAEVEGVGRLQSSVVGDPPG